MMRGPGWARLAVHARHLGVGGRTAIDGDVFIEGEPRFERALDWTGVRDPAESPGWSGAKPAGTCTTNPTCRGVNSGS